jgi:hypothetical protein
MRKLEIKTNDQLNIGILSQTGLLKLALSNKSENINEKYFVDETNFIIKKQNELKEVFEDSSLRTHNQLRKILLLFTTEIQDLKRHLDQNFLNK